jgi:hypothetical protein
MNRLFARRPAGVFCALGMLFFLQGANAGEPWIAPGNVQVRHDIQLLVDSGVMDMPMSGWPIATSDLARALDHMGCLDNNGRVREPIELAGCAQCVGIDHRQGRHWKKRRGSTAHPGTGGGHRKAAQAGVRGRSYVGF